MDKMSLIGWALYALAAIASAVFFFTVYGVDVEIGPIFVWSFGLLIGFWIFQAFFPSEDVKSQIEIDRISRDLDKRLEERDPEAYQAKMHKRSLSAIYGATKPEVICPHCSAKGHVRVKAGVAKDRTQETGVGALIAPTRITERKVQNAYCDNCKMTWQV
jgi:hypothetical protein